MSEPSHPYVWQSTELPATSDDQHRFWREVPPPAGYMLHSWSISPIGELVICWVRMRPDLASELSLRLLDRTRPKESEG